jgi:uncharacterized membrane protein YeaQ/YmgE (transglycosylase-associated protein family)
MFWLWDLLGWIIFGLIAGTIAKWLTPGDDPQGCLVTSVIGIIGSIIGGWLAKVLKLGGDVDGFNLVSFAIAILGSIVLLTILRFLRPPQPPLV